MARKKLTMDGNTAAAHVSYAFTEVAGIYPITPSSPMADYVDQWSAAGREEYLRQPGQGCGDAVRGRRGRYGARLSGRRRSDHHLHRFPGSSADDPEYVQDRGRAAALRCSTSLPERVATHALNIFGDHSDVYACRQTGFAMLCETNLQEVMDLGAVAHLAAIKGRVPFINFFDGFRTSHEIQKIEVWDYDDLKEMCDMDAVEAFRKHCLNPERPAMRGSSRKRRYLLPAP